MKRLLYKLGITDAASFWHFVSQFIKFGIVGVSNTVISLSTYYVLVYFGVHYMFANAVGFAMGLFNSYFWNSRYVFSLKKRSEGNKALRKELRVFCKMAAVYGVVLLWGSGLLFVMVDILGISQLLAPVINVFATVPVSFLLNKLWAFR